jgi:hypothetical protein
MLGNRRRNIRARPKYNRAFPDTDTACDKLEKITANFKKTSSLSQPIPAQKNGEEILSEYWRRGRDSQESGAGF